MRTRPGASWSRRSGSIATPARRSHNERSTFLTIERVEVTADERWFRVDVDRCEVNPAGHTALERRVMQTWRWFTP